MNGPLQVIVALLAPAGGVSWRRAAVVVLATWLLLQGLIPASAWTAVSLTFVVGESLVRLAHARGPSRHPSVTGTTPKEVRCRDPSA